MLNILDALGNNIRTNVSLGELRAAADIASGVNMDEIISLPLSGEDVSLVRTDNIHGQSIVRPVRGLTDYTDIQAYIREAFRSRETNGAQD
jgi:hypothetical protein